MCDTIEVKLNSLLEEARILEISRELDLVRFTFQRRDGGKLFLHAQCLIRIFDADDKLVICTEKLYCKSPNYKKKRFDWYQPGITLFDDSLKEYQDKLYGTMVLNTFFCNEDLKIEFVNGMYMDVLAITTIYDYPEYTENYRIFSEDKKEPYCIV